MTPTQAATDLHAYRQAMRRGNCDDGFAIEQRWNVDGLPPQQVAQFLADVAAGATTDEAMRALLDT